MCLSSLLVVQVLARSDVTGSTRSDPALFHQRKPCALPAQHLPLRRPVRRESYTIRSDDCLVLVPAGFIECVSMFRS